MRLRARTRRSWRPHGGSVAAVKAIVTAERLRRTCRSFGYFVNRPRARPRRLAYVSLFQKIGTLSCPCGSAGGQASNGCAGSLRVAALECRHRENAALRAARDDKGCKDRARVDRGGDTVQDNLAQWTAIDRDLPSRNHCAVLHHAQYRAIALIDD